MPSKNIVDFANQVKSYAFGIKDQQVLGAWNQLSSKYETSSGTISGVTWTDNEDGTIMSSGTASANSWFILTENTKLGSTGTYLLRGCPTGGSSETYFLRVRDETTSTNYNDYGNGIEINIDSTHNYTVSCGILNGATAPSALWKPMILTAMTNRELTDGIKSSFYNATTTNTNLSSFDCAVSKFGKVVSIYFQFKCSTTTLDASESLFTLPEEYRPRRNFAVKTGDIGGNCTKESHQLEFSASTGEIKVFIRETHDASRWISANVTYITP